jgi:hypothetical protein
MAFYTAQERFFAKHLGGRFQESVTPEVQRKLTALTVDVTTVTLPTMTKTELAPSAVSAFNGTMVRAGTSHYTTKMSMMGQEVNITTTRSVAEETLEGKKVWRVIDESSGPMGAGVDTLDLDATTLFPIHRAGRQGMATMWFNFNKEGVEGKIIAGGQEMPVNAKLSSPVLSEGAGVEIAVGSLPLAEGYSGSIDVFSVMQAKARKMNVRVAGTEKVTVSAGTFDTYKVEITPQDDEGGGSKLWITRDDHRTVRLETQLPTQMGGGTIASELTK